MRALRITAGRRRRCVEGTAGRASSGTRMALSCGWFTSAPGERVALVEYRRAVRASDHHAAVAVDDAVAGWAGALVPRPGADDFFAVASASVAADGPGDTLPSGAVTNARTHERVRDLVQNRVADFGFVVQFDQVSGERDLALAVVAFAEADLRTVEAEGPRGSYLVRLHELVGKLLGFR